MVPLKYNIRKDNAINFEEILFQVSLVCFIGKKNQIHKGYLKFNTRNTARG